MKLEAETFLQVKFLLVCFQICLLYAKTELMSKAVLAHEGPVNLLESAYHSPSRKHTVPTLVSYGRDLHIHVWHVVFVKDAILTSLITLQLMYSVGFVEIMLLFQYPVICCSLFV